jgi:hypothetical protein
MQTVFQKNKKKQPTENQYFSGVQGVRVSILEIKSN